MDAEDIVEINSFDPKLTINELIELKKRRAVEEIGECFDPRGKEEDYPLQSCGKFYVRPWNRV